MIGRAARFALIFCWLAWPILSHAQTYMWRDATGVHYAGICPTGVTCQIAGPRQGTAYQQPGTGYQAPAPQLRSPVGTNLDGIAYWSPQLPFLDVMKFSSPWISGDGTNWDNQQPLDLDANGWVRSLAPGQIARKLTLREIGDRYPGGQYTVRYKGEGTLKFGFAAQVVSQAPGQMLLQVTPNSGGVYLVIEATNPANYLRDIEIIMPGGICEGDFFTHAASAEACTSAFLPFADHHRTIIFYPVFANRLRGYSALRFMDWMSTNNSPVRNWGLRTTVAYSTWSTTGGAPLEVMIALANLLQVHPWFTLPHQADDAYAQQFAALVRARLDPKLGVYVEHSNEVWNSQFKQYADTVNAAKAQTPPLDNMQYHALRSRSIGKIFKDALGGTRVTAVLGAQAANPWTATRGLDYLKSQFGSAIGIDAVAIAPYFGISVKPAELLAYEALSLDALFSSMSATVSQSGKWVADYRATVANAYGVRLIGYEGGQHMVGIWGAENSAALNTLFDDFNRDPRIKQMYLAYLAGWKQNGGELFVHFTDVSRYTKWGRWGALEYISQARQESPKFDALQTFIEQNPVWWKQ